MKVINGCFTMQNTNYPLYVKRYGHEERTRLHEHDFIEFAFVDQGFSMHRVCEDVSLLLPGDILFILPGIKHEYWKSLNNSVYNCMFYPEVLQGDLSSLVRLPLLDKVLSLNREAKWSKIHLRTDSRHEILSLLKKLENETNNMPLGWEIRSKALLTDFLVCLSRVWDNLQQAQSDIDITITNTASGLMHILEQSINNKKSIEEIANIIGYSPEYFSRLFKKLTGLSPSAYLISMKVAAAAQILLEQDVPISEAAEAAGFEDVNYFSRIFKKETGKTPSEFRNMTKMVF